MNHQLIRMTGMTAGATIMPCSLHNVTGSDMHSGTNTALKTEMKSDESSCSSPDPVQQDAVWRSAGDRSADFNWYTKRGLLAAVYVPTVNFWMDDKSDGSADSWAFLDRRLVDAMRLPMKTKGMLQKLGGGFPRPSRVVKHLKRRRLAGSW